MGRMEQAGYSANRGLLLWHLELLYALAQDLLRFGITAEEWLRRSRDLTSCAI